MSLKVYSILFGIITVISARPSKDSYSVANENELHNLLMTLYQQGKFDISFSHYEDTPNAHHEDKARIFSHDDNSVRNPTNSDEFEDKTYKAHTNADNNKFQYLKLLSKGDSNTEKVNQENSINNLLSILKDLNRNKEESDEDSPEIKHIKLYRNGDRCEYGNCKNVRSDDQQDRDDCRGNRCGRGRSDDRDDSNDKDDCRGNRCGRGRSGDRSDYDNDRDDFIDALSEKLGNDKQSAQEIREGAKRYRINDNLDALVFDLSQLDNAQKNRFEKESNKMNFNDYFGAQLNQMLENKNKDDSEEREAYIDVQSKPLEAVIVDLTKSDMDMDGNIQELMHKIQDPLERNRHKNYFSKSVLESKSDSQILSHGENNNNVYVPQWLLDDFNSKKRPLRAAPMKQALPLTAKQRKRSRKTLTLKGILSKGKDDSSVMQNIRRRSADDNSVGVPFRFDIQSLSQINE